MDSSRPCCFSGELILSELLLHDELELGHRPGGTFLGTVIRIDEEGNGFRTLQPLRFIKHCRTEHEGTVHPKSRVDDGCRDTELAGAVGEFDNRIRWVGLKSHGPPGAEESLQGDSAGVAIGSIGKPRDALGWTGDRDPVVRSRRELVNVNVITRQREENADTVVEVGICRVTRLRAQYEEGGRRSGYGN